MPEHMMTTAEAAERLGVRPETVTRWAKRGLIKPVHKVPGLRGALIFAAAEVERVAAERGAA